MIKKLYLNRRWEKLLEAGKSSQCEQSCLPVNKRKAEDNYSQHSKSQQMGQKQSHLHPIHTSKNPYLNLRSQIQNIVIKRRQMLYTLWCAQLSMNTHLSNMWKQEETYLYSKNYTF